MALEKIVIRQSGQMIGSVTSGYSDESTTVRDRQDRILGHASKKFSSTRDSAGRLVSTNTASPGLLIKKK
jgi:hypothetical protein